MNTSFCHNDISYQYCYQGLKVQNAFLSGLEPRGLTFLGSYLHKTITLMIRYNYMLQCHLIYSSHLLSLRLIIINLLTTKPTLMNQGDSLFTFDKTLVSVSFAANGLCVCVCVFLKF